MFFAELENKKVKTIAITGTKGKTTTSIFCKHILTKLGYKTLLLGNLGIPALELLNEAKNSDFVILELSSHQTSDLLNFPNIAILLNLFPEHLNWYLTHENYYKDKCNLLNNSKYKIVNGNNEKTVKYTNNIFDKILFSTEETIYYKDKDGYFCDGNKKILNSFNMKLLGEHNYQNLCAVLTALKILNIDFLRIKQEYFDDFQPVEHRLETIIHNNILFVNDSISTIPEATIACYKTFKDKNIYGILSGFDRQQNYNELVNYIIQNPNIKFIALLGETSNRMFSIFKKNNFKNLQIFNTLSECVHKLYNLAKNAVIILSPASASYDLYKNFQGRGKDFKKILNSL